ncbi:MAG TPA: glycosyltransferase family 39 protein, partial [Solirubrobacteraceae bacterium]
MSTTQARVGVARRELIVLALLSALAFALRLTSLSRSLFNDETVSLALAQRSFGHMFSLYGYEANGTPYSLVLWPTIRIFGTQEAVLRLPALIAGTLSIPAMYWSAQAFSARRWVALLAAGLLAINPMAVWYSQVARSYAFVVLAACIAFGALVRLIEEPDRRGMFWLYVAGMVLLSYSDLLAPVLVLPAQALIVWFGGVLGGDDRGAARERRRADLQRWFAALVAVFVLCVPLLIAGLISRGRRDALYWLPKLSRGLVEEALKEFSGGFANVTAVRWLTLLVLVVLVGAATWSLRRRRREDERARNTLLVALAWGVLPIALLLVVSAAYPLFWPRYAILALPGLCLLAALATERLSRNRAELTIAGCCLVVLVGVGLYADAKQVDSVQQEWRPTMSWLHSSRRVAEPLVVDSVLALP